MFDTPLTSLSTDDMRRELDLVKQVLRELNARLAWFEQVEAEEDRQWRLITRIPHK